MKESGYDSTGSAACPVGLYELPSPEGARNIYIYIYARAIQVTGPVAKPQAARRARHPELTVVCQPPGRSPQEHGLDFGRRPQHEGFSSCTQGPRRRPKAMRAAKDPVR